MKLELEQFLGEHDTDVFLLKETGADLCFAKYNSQRNYRLWKKAQRKLSAKAQIITLCPVSGLQHIETTATLPMLVLRSVKLFARTNLDRVALDRMSVRWLPVLMAGDLNAKDTDWNSRLNTAKRMHLWNYINRNCGLMRGPNCPHTVPYTHTLKHNMLFPTSSLYCFSRNSFYWCIRVSATRSAALFYSDRNRKLISSSEPNKPNPLQANRVACIPGLLWGGTHGEFYGKWLWGNRQVCPGDDQNHSRNHRGICSKALTPSRKIVFLPTSI
jgi:hypothetical protein